MLFAVCSPVEEPVVEDLASRRAPQIIAIMPVTNTDSQALPVLPGRFLGESKLENHWTSFLILSTVVLNHGSPL